MPPKLQVVAAIVYNQHEQILLNSRPQGKAYAGYWEFAGGKVEANETEFQALQRELNEELGIHIQRATPYLAKIHAYEHATVHLRFYRIAAKDWTGEPQARENQQLAWQNPAEPTVMPMLPANSHLLSVLTMPQYLSGNLKTGLRNRDDTYRIAPYPADAHTPNIMLTLAQLQQLGKVPSHHHVWVIVQNTREFQAAQDADAIIWRVNEALDANKVLQNLHEGSALPIAIYAPASLCQQYGVQWQQAGAQAIIEEGDMEVV